MTVTPPPRIDLDRTAASWPDDVADLTDRRRLLVRSVLGVDLPPSLVGLVFASRPGDAAGQARRRGALPRVSAPSDRS